MKNALQITLKDKSVITLDVIVKTTYETTIKVDELLEPGNLPLFLSIQHKQLNTLLELSKVSPFVLLYFDEYNFFTGASFSINGDKSQFSIQSQSKKIVLHPFPVPFELNQVFELSYKLIENDNDNRNSDHRSFEHRAFTKGYGQFPYVILKTGNALFMQIPIHFNKNNDIENYPGTHINEISKTVLDNYEIDKSSNYMRS